MFGIGMGLLFVAATPLPNQWFTKRRALAMGICAAGSGAGGVIFSICTNLMIQNISLAWAFRISAILMFAVNSIVILVLRDRIKIISAKYKSFDMSLLRNFGFVSVILWGFIMLFGYVSVMYSLSDYAVSVGLTQQQGSVVTGMFSAGIMIGRPLMGLVADSIGRVNLSIICTIGTAVTCFVIWMFATSYGVMIFFAIIHGSPFLRRMANLRCNEWSLLDHGNACDCGSSWSPRSGVCIIPIMAAGNSVTNNMSSPGLDLMLTDSRRSHSA